MPIQHRITSLHIAYISDLSDLTRFSIRFINIRHRLDHAKLTPPISRYFRRTTMTNTMADSDPPNQKLKLYQSKLTSSFFRPKHGSAKDNSNSSTSSKTVTESSDIKADLATPRQNDGDSARGPVNLHPERRSNLAHPPPNLRPTRSAMLAHIAAETKALLPNLLKTTPQAPVEGALYHPGNLFRLDPRFCPSLPQTAIRVLNGDTIDAAIDLSTPTASQLPGNKPVLVLNMANAHHSGGGWLHGALAQEEAMCYRSSLSFTLKYKYYPIPEAGGIYSPTVVVIRQNMSYGHALMDLSKPGGLPVFSCVSVAAIRGPAIEKDAAGKERYKRASDRETMKEKMRVVLRIAAVKRHRVLVLGALGCGAFANPRGEVVECWKEVFSEGEFQGGWWERIVFAVMEPGATKDGDSNFGVFYKGLDGMMV